MKKALQTAVLALIIFSNAFASGFQLNEHGAKAMSMANAFTAYANDPSALYFNPAAIAFHKGTKIMLGVSPIAPSYSFEGPSPSTTSTDAENKVFLPFNFYATHKINEQWAVGFAVNVPFGLGTEWDQAWAGKYLAIETELQTFFFQPVVAFKPSENISISVGVNFSLADVTIKRKNYEVAALNPDVLASVEGDDTGFGFTAAIMFKPSDKISLGAAYRSEVSYDFEGDATSEPSSVTHPLLGTIALPQGEVTAPLTLPQNLQAGIAYHLNEKLTLAADFQYTGWSSYDKLEITFTEANVVSSAARDYENNFAIRGGFEYQSSKQLAIRGGLYYDKNPIKDEVVEPTLPDNDRIGFAGGVGIGLAENINLDLGYLFLLMGDREITDSEFDFNGTYSTTVHLFAVNLTLGL